ncbi:MAG: hypothetical protein UZ01_01164 [Candidatus Brocadia sinica]|nr:MAG: hypothetical protein UZ01_01164 [Candidatus Brocadia sinica]
MGKDRYYPIGGQFIQKVKTKISKKLKKGLPLSIRQGHTIRLEVTKEPLTVHTGLSLHYAMAEALTIPQILVDYHIRVKEREYGYPESEHILALSANAFAGGDYLDDLEALREDVAIQMAIGRKDIPEPTTAGDFRRRFSLGHILQMNKAFGKIQQSVYRDRTDVTGWTIDVDAKVHGNNFIPSSAFKSIGRPHTETMCDHFEWGIDDNR